MGENNKFLTVRQLCLEFGQWKKEVQANEKPFNTISGIFPNVTQFSCEGHTKQMSHELPLIFRLWPEIERLEVDYCFLVGGNSVEDLYELDTTFTGIGKTNWKY